MACHQGDPRGRTRTRPGHQHHQFAAALPQVPLEPARSHALRGNNQWRAIKAIPVAEREQDPATDTTSLPPLYPK
ncbi:hypothetical protein [Pseudomonas lactis]|uniref:Uncharacterized protein n=1 Tax=Pseudomonas azotoformans TaxID=47878 RepID=A0A4Q0HNG9_PSEAZ|nr:hypothetical protein [Pseudomonas lactis]RXE50530.1 hypothetical protein B4O85_24800 [Pseudomonas azotoformans]